MPIPCTLLEKDQEFLFADILKYFHILNYKSMDNKKLIAFRSLIIAAGATVAASFVGVYGVMIGATAAEMGWLQSSSNSLSNLGQILWGRISDRVGKRKPFLVSGSVILAVLWFMLPYSRTPVNLIVLYSLISIFSAMITVNWYSFIADNIISERGRFLTLINDIASAGTIVSLIAMVFILAKYPDDVVIPFSTAAASYVISAVTVFKFKESKSKSVMTRNLYKTLKNLKNNNAFYKYFRATNIQSFFWSMAWPMFPITIVSIMHFSLEIVAVLTISSTLTMLLTQYIIGKFIDKVNRVPIIFLNRIMLSGIPLMYAFFNILPLFILLEIYSGFIGSIQNTVTTSYTLDIVPQNNKAEYISILNGFNGMVYFFGALTGGYVLTLFLSIEPLKIALLLSYLIVFAGRFLSSFLFRGLIEENSGGRNNSVLSILFKPKGAGSPSGAVIHPR